MYQPSHFVQSDAAQIRALVAAHPLATVFHHAGGAPTADHMPLLWDSDGGSHGTLRGHVARANPLWREMAGQTVLAVFHGPQAYITPSWYPSKAATGKAVPTWNYAVVHLRGTLRAVDDAAWLHAFVDRLTHAHEDARAHPWQVSDAPADYRDAMVRAIVGLEIAVTQVEAKWKVSQNRSEPDRLGAAAGLMAEPAEAARAMAALIPR
ncbi:MAG: FMN-binding negative transcriptional regulator [Burkholderiaceae bacterium]